LIPATLIVVVDHALRGTFWPQSIFGVEWASQWRWLEHAGWVVFEDIFLIWGCIRASREMDMLALRQAELETTNERVEAEVTLKTARLESVTQELVATARRAGMAEIATGVLHNVGNVLNTVNVSASVATEAVRRSEVQSLIRAGDLLKKNQGNLGAYLTSDDHGKHLPGFFIELADCLGQEQGVVLGELANLAQGLEHIKKIISAQQRHAKRGTLRERILPAELFEQALAMDAQANAGTEIQIVRDYAAVGPAVLDKHKVLQILINLLSNARKAVDAGGGSQQRITLSIGPIEVNGEKGLFFAVMDNGVGIEPENLDKVFAHGFTTFKDGHGFGLHSAANEAKVMGGGLTVRSDGAGSGTTFTLELPLGSMTEAEIMMADKKGTTCNRP
jgi:signal transduction histidine kinase